LYKLKIIVLLEIGIVEKNNDKPYYTGLTIVGKYKKELADREVSPRFKK